jgi:drug/metabolite transporter (DMT)-like permease
MQTSGVIFLFGYILFLGIGTFLQKLSMKELSPYQLHFLISLGMIITAVPILLFQQKSFAIPAKGILLGSSVGLLFALGSFLFTLSLSKLPVGIATAISLSYLLVVLLLSALFLKETITPVKIVGIMFTLVGVIMLTFQTQQQ